jgi:hypothetical protein
VIAVIAVIGQQDPGAQIVVIARDHRNRETETGSGVIGFYHRTFVASELYFLGAGPVVPG